MAQRPTGRRRTLEALTPEEKRVIEDLHRVGARIVYDGRLDDVEFVMLTNWVKDNAAYAEVKPLSDLVKLLRSILRDGQVTVDERLTLLNFLGTVIKSPKPVMDGLDSIFETDPQIVFKKKAFCFTGTFAFGERDKARVAVLRLGGRVLDEPSLALDYLVVGSPGPETTRIGMGSSKLERAISAIRQGAPTHLIREKDFVRAVVGNK